MAKIITKWEECGRDDLSMIPKMTAAGFVPQFSQKDRMSERTTVEDIPHDEVQFVDPKRSVHVWKCYRRFDDGIGFFWQVADLDNGSYLNHRQYDSLEDVLAKEAAK